MVDGQLNLFFFLFSSLFFVATTSESSALSSMLKPMLKVDWKRLQDLPPQGPGHSGLQDSDGGWLLNNSVVVTAFGYGGGGVPGFFNTCWAFNTTHSDWKQLPDAPISGRQEVAATSVGDDSLIYVGGFNYIAPQWTYSDVVKLSVDIATGLWSWSKLAPFPHPIMSAGVTSIGSTVFVVGGADYDGKRFYNMNDRSGGVNRLGSRMYSLDTSNSSAAWIEHPQLPGPPRWVHSVTAVKGQIYVIGGAVTTQEGTTYTVVDTWVYKPSQSAWEPLPSLPVASGNFQTNGAGAFMDRYILLVGGYPYGEVYALNGSVVPTYGQPQQLCPPKQDLPSCRKGCDAKTATKPGGSEYYNDIWAFDTEARVYGTVLSTSREDPELIPQGCGGFPMNDNLPQTNMAGDKVFVVGGECDPRTIGAELYTHYPQLVLEGTIQLA